VAIEVGQPAPDFTLPAHDGDTVQLSALRGTPVVIAFFPLAFSPVCMDQFGGLGEQAAAYGGDDARVLAISVDHSLSQAAFAEKLGLSGVTFLSDFEPRGAVADAYGVFVPERGHGGRAVLVVDAEGVVRSTQYVHPLSLPDADGVRSAVAACAPA
jgi:peroxiredoxin